MSGEMGKKNNWEDPPMIIRLIGESWWKDETTQKKNVSCWTYVHAVLIKTPMNSSTLKIFMTKPKDLALVA